MSFEEYCRAVREEAKKYPALEKDVTEFALRLRGAKIPDTRPPCVTINSWRRLNQWFSEKSYAKVGHSEGVTGTTIQRSVKHALRGIGNHAHPNHQCVESIELTSDTADLKKQLKKAICRAEAAEAIVIKMQTTLAVTLGEHMRLFGEGGPHD